MSDKGDKKAAGCPCGSGLTYEACCGRYIDSEANAPTAEALMRSRYTAYTLANEAYLLDTWHPKTRPDSIAFSDIEWRSLEIVRCARGRSQDAKGKVEFIARFEVEGNAGSMHEVSEFIRHAGRWYYVSGKQK